MDTENINPDPFIEDDTEDDEWEYEEDYWEPSCANDCELCGCHGDCPDCDTDYDEDYED